MASLRRTRRFSSSPTPQERQQLPYHDRDPYYDHLPVLGVEGPSGVSRGESSDTRDETRSRSVRKVKSQLAVKPSNTDYHGGWENEGFNAAALYSNVSPGGIEPRDRKKRHGKGVRSQSARSRDLGDRTFSSLQATASDEDSHRTPTPGAQPALFLVPKSRSRSQSRSPSPMPSYPPLLHPQDDSRSPTSQSYRPAAVDSKPRSKRRRAATCGSRSRSSSEDGVAQKSPKLSRLPTPSSRAASPLPPTLNTQDLDSSFRAEHACRSTSPAVQISSRAPLSLSLLPLNTRRETSKKNACDTPSPSSSRARSHSRASQASPLHMPPSQPSASSTPRTLQDVTRRLEETQGRLQKTISAHPESTARSVDPRFSQQTSPGAEPMPPRNRNRQELDTNVYPPAIDPEPRNSKERSRVTQTRPRYGLALTNEDGQRLGEPNIENSLPDHSPAPRKGTTPEVTTRHSPVSAHHMSPARPVDALGSDPSMRSNDRRDRINQSMSPHKASCDTQQHWQDKATSKGPASLIRGNGGTKDEAIQSRGVSYGRPPLTHETSFEENDWRQRSSRRDDGSRVRRLDKTISSMQPSVAPSSLPKPPLKPILVSRQPSTPVRSVFPHLPAPRTTHTENSFSHKPNISDTSASSLPRLRKLVIRNPGPSDGASSASSSNPGTPKSDPVDSSGEFTFFALSASQNSMAAPTTRVDYLVPDDVAAEVANDEERRRRALVGLVNDLDLTSNDQVKALPAQGLPKARPSRASWSSVVPRQRSHRQRGVEDENEEDDDAFFARLSMHDDGGSLLEEPQPEADSGFRDDDDGFDEENSDFDDETGSEDGEDEEEDPPLPPTPKFVHPLGEGDDLESRITRVTSLNRISPTPPSPSSRSRRPEQGPQMSSRADFLSSLQPPRIPAKGDARIISNQNVSERAEMTWPRGSDPHTQLQIIPSEVTNQPEISEPSLTDHVQEDTVSPSQSQASISVSDNEPSLVGGGRLSDADSVMEETLSSGAEALFRQLQVEADAQPAVHPTGEISMSETRFDAQGEPSRPREEISGSQTAGRLINRNSSLTKPHEPASLRTWRSTLPYGAYDSLAERHGPSEMRRQEIIWELCETEQAFVKSLRLILRLFVQPLRHEDRTWISGVPRDVTRLFDWFDDIMHLHSQISSALHATRSAQYPVVIQVAETLRPFIPRLELHQPYLVRLENVSSAIEVMSKDMRSDFGEFVRIQTASPDCESMNLPSFLLKPVQRLMKYPLFFKQLWELTPRSHPDHLPTFSLLHSTDMIIRVMQEVKAREEEYELVKNLASRIKGLPPGYQLARRERRLIAQGLLRRVILSDKERIDLETAMDARESHRSRNTSVSSTLSSFTGDWAHHPTRTGNMPTLGTDRSLHAESITSDATLDSNASLSRSNSKSTSRSRSSSMRGALRQRSKETSVYAFVFTDLMILTTPLSERTHLLRSPRNAGETKETWKLIDDLGVSRVLGVTDQSGQLANHEHLIVVELMSMTPSLLDTGAFSDGAAAIPVYLSVSDARASTQESGFDALAEPKAKWLDAFERCFRFTLRSLSFPSYGSSHSTSTDLELDTKSSVMSILSSGLPLPISPSQQLGEAQRGRPANLVQEEREERGWWSLRFHQVLKEVQRSSRSPVLDAAPYRNSGTRSKHQAGKRSEPRPLILSPNPLITITPYRKGGLLSLGRKKSK